MRAAVLALVAGCALTSKSQPVELRYFSPPTHAVAEAPAGARVQLRLGRINPGELLRSRIVYRQSPVEVSTYDTLRWSDEPGVYVRRSLARALYDGQQLEQVVGGMAPTLDVDVIAFEEVRRGTTRFGRVELRYQLRDDRVVVARGTVAIERPATATIDSVVVAIGSALDGATTEVARRVAASVRTLAAREPRREHE